MAPYCPRPECALDGEPAEYQSFVERCLDCGGELTDEVPAWATEPLPESELVRVKELANSALIPLVRSVLEEAGIACFIRDERAQGLVAWAGVGTGLNPKVGAPAVFVLPENADEAKELLATLDAELDEDLGPATGVPELDDYEAP